jgi:anti-sigma factor RsiW
MNITRNNYETYFLLYADGELNDADKKAVEQFITLHPDLAEELDLLLEAVLEPADIAMPGKHLLLKPEKWNQEDLTQQQQELLLLLDNELTAERTAEIHTEIEADPLLQQEWSILKQTRLTAAAVEIPDKKSLYRNERDRKPVPISWVKWMAAAAVVAGLGWYGLSFWNSRQVTISPSVIATVDPVKTSPANPSSVATHIVDNDQNTESTTAATNTNAVKNSENMAVAPKVTRNNKKENLSENRTNERVVDIQQEPVQTLAIENQPLVQTVKEKAIDANTNASLHVKEITNPIATYAVQPMPDETQPGNIEDADETEYVNIAGAHIKKQKLRSVFRNVTRTVSRTFDKSNVAQADVASLR